MLTKTQRDRLKKAEKADRIVFVVTPEEAIENETEKVDTEAMETEQVNFHEIFRLNEIRISLF